MIRTIEELSLNALPALETMVYDGWLLRFSKGYARRANSIYPLYEPKADVNEKIRTCEELYSSKGLDIIYKITPEIYPSNLDAILEEYEYKIDAPTSVQLVDLDKIDGANSEGLTYSITINEEWLQSFCSMSNVPEERKDLLYSILKNIIPKKFFVLMKQQERVIGCGLGVLQDDFIGLYNIEIDKEYRNKGYGKKLVLNLLRLGKVEGAKKAYLQVMLNNPAALKLYSNIGFREEYKYWYRVKNKEI